MAKDDVTDAKSEASDVSTSKATAGSTVAPSTVSEEAHS